MKSNKGTRNPTGKKKVLQMKRKEKTEADAFTELAKAMDGLRSARSSLLRLRAGLLDYDTPDAAHTILDAANYLIDQAHHFTHQAMNIACLKWWGREIDYNPLATDEPEKGA